MEYLKKILLNQELMMWVMAVIVFLLTEVLKLPIKALTKKLGETARLRVNAVIVLLSVGFGVLIYFLYCTYVAHIPFQVSSGASLGGLASMVYEAVSRLIGKNLDNPYTTEDGKEALENVKNAMSDGIVTKEEAKSVLTTTVKNGKKNKKEEQTENDKLPKEIKDFVDNIGLK